MNIRPTTNGATGSGGPSPVRLAYFSPLPPARSGIADYSRELLSHLAKLASLTLFANYPEQVDAELQQQFSIQPTGAYPALRWQFDLALYQMGNSIHHDGMYPVALRYPGLVVLHDYSLHHFIAHRTAGQGNYTAYVRELGYALGPAGVNLAWDIYYGRAEHPLFELPLNNRLLDTSLGLAIHSRQVAETVHQQRPDLPLQIIPALMTVHQGIPRRQALGLPAEAVIFASVGLVTAAKQMELALRAFARLRQVVPQAHYLIVGEVHEEVDLPGLLAGLDLTGAIHVTGFVETVVEFIDWTATADVIVNLRYPTVGETSAAALRALAAGRPVIVFDHGWYSELPDKVAVKIPLLDEAALLAAMLSLAQQPERRQAMGQAATTYIQQQHDPGRVAEYYLAFIEEVLAQVDARLGGPRA
ncbi:MAG: glycosyltransferase [Chloroflexi bacterium]|nr:glycosyltransferase [Chloroflexota bacterium]MCI0574709.1 glycosyltransferase [Chloroflexota bacterium]MCI0647398.1 glycosyltransferase [Chloroflexota bacterium]MCI0728877.1 glycosyltransferase [Chloroflexota bacterium]